MGRSDEEWKQYVLQGKYKRHSHPRWPVFKDYHTRKHLMPWWIQTISTTKKCYWIDGKMDEVLPILEKYSSEKAFCLYVMMFYHQYCVSSELHYYLRTKSSNALCAIFLDYHLSLPHSSENVKHELIYFALKIGNMQVINHYFETHDTIEPVTQFSLFHQALRAVHAETQAVLKTLLMKPQMNSQWLLDVVYYQNQMDHEICFRILFAKHLELKDFTLIWPWRILRHAINLGTDQEVQFIINHFSSSPEYIADKQCLRRACQNGRLELIPPNMRDCEACRESKCKDHDPVALISDTILAERESKSITKHALSVHFPSCIVDTVLVYTGFLN